MFRCHKCLAILNALAPLDGTSPQEVRSVYEGARRKLAEAIWGTPELRGRPSLDPFITIEGGRNPPSLVQTERLVDSARRWLDHLKGLAEKGALADLADLEAHVGGWEPELDVKYPPDPEPLRAGFKAWQPRLQRLREARDTLQLKRERLESHRRAGRPTDPELVERAERAVRQAEGGLDSEQAAVEVVAAARGVGPRGVRKSMDDPPEAREPGPDHRELILSQPPLPGSPRVYIDIEELERRHPGAWGRVTGNET